MTTPVNPDFSPLKLLTDFRNAISTKTQNAINFIGDKLSELLSQVKHPETGNFTSAPHSLSSPCESVRESLPKQSLVESCIVEVAQNLDATLPFQIGSKMLAKLNITMPVHTDLEPVILQAYLEPVVMRTYVEGISPGQQALNNQLYAAVNAGDVNKAVQLLQQGADVNGECKVANRATSPLKEAVVCRYEAMVEFLLSKGAKIHVQGDSLLHRAIETGSTGIAKQIYHNDPTTGKYLNQVKMLVHRFALKGTLKDFEGMWNSTTMSELRNSAAKFLKSGHPSIGSIDAGKINRALNTPMASREDIHKAREAIEMGEICAFQTMWTIKPREQTQVVGHDYQKRETHATGVVICKNPQGEYLLIRCNRGWRNMNNQKAGLTISVIKNPENIEMALQKLQDNKNSSMEGQTYFEEGIEIDLGIERNDNKIVSHKDQSIGNCRWASAKLLKEATAYGNLWQQGKSHDDCTVQARVFYKAFTASDRQESLKILIEFLKTTPKENLTTAKLAENGLPSVPEMIGALMAKSVDIPAVEAWIDLLKEQGLMEEFKQNSGALLILSENLMSRTQDLSKVLQLERLLSANGLMTQDVKNALTRCALRSMHTLKPGYYPEFFSLLLEKKDLFSSSGEFVISHKDLFSELYLKARDASKTDPEGYAQFLETIFGNGTLVKDQWPIVSEILTYAHVRGDPSVLQLVVDQVPQNVPLETATDIVSNLRFPRDMSNFEKLVSKLTPEIQNNPDFRDACNKALTNSLRTPTVDIQDVPEDPSKMFQRRGELLNLGLHSEILRSSVSMGNFMDVLWCKVKNGSIDSQMEFLSDVLRPGHPMLQDQNKEALKSLIYLVANYNSNTAMQHIASLGVDVRALSAEIAKTSRFSRNPLDDMLRFGMSGCIRLLEKGQPIPEDRFPPVRFLLENGAQPNMSIKNFPSKGLDISLSTGLAKLQRWDDLEAMLEDPRTSRDEPPMNSIPKAERDSMTAAQLVARLKS